MTTSTYTPEWSGLAERMNRAIMAQVWAMLNETPINHRLRRETSKYEAGLDSSTISAVLNMITRIQILVRRVPDSFRLRSFGSRTDVHRDKLQTKIKLDDGVGIEVYMTTGYGLHRIYKLRIKAEVSCEHVTFHETVYPYQDAIKY